MLNAGAESEERGGAKLWGNAGKGGTLNLEFECLVAVKGAG